MLGIRWWLSLVLFVSSGALAEDTTESTLAEDVAAGHFERGVALFKEHAFRAAIVEFQAAYDVSPDYRLLYNLARSKQQLQDDLGAAEDFEAYLLLGGSELEPGRRSQVEQTLTSLSSRLSRIEVSVNRAGADVLVDDVRVGVAPLDAPMYLNPGRHRVTARAADGREGAQVVDLAAGDLTAVALTLFEPERVLAVANDLRPAEAPRWSLQRKLALTGWITGGALLATSLVTGVCSLREQAWLHDQIETLGVDPSAVAHRRSKVDRLSLATDVLIGTGAAVAVAGTALWWASPERRERKAARATPARARLGLEVGPRSLALRGHF